ncbi:MAG: hypothetical protein B6241_07795 [Spirochaetaceae bacterium 4572_59]|nr:MAG: hypothetical protein B6241_07795 [Spirochaetaceae bacterium 4572_59]
MSNQLTVIVDNRAEKPYQKEHGFSLLIEWNGKRILFDTAQGKAFFHNAELLGISLEQLDALILSHGHYDHGGNLAAVLEKNPHMPVYAHPDCVIDRYSLHKDGKIVPVNLSEKDRKALLSHPEESLHWCREAEEVFPGLWFSGSIPRIHEDEDTGGSFFLEKEMVHTDSIPDDISICLEYEDHLSLICGCCHAGVRNTIDRVQAIRNQKSVEFLMGGFHLVHAGEKRISDTISFIDDHQIRRIIPAHCTGELAMKRFKQELSGKVSFGLAGLKLPL